MSMSENVPRIAPFLSTLNDTAELNHFKNHTIACYFYYGLVSKWCGGFVYAMRRCLLSLLMMANIPLAFTQYCELTLSTIHPMYKKAAGLFWVCNAGTKSDWMLSQTDKLAEIETAN